MCIGIPMQIVEIGFASAVCEGMGARREVDTMLIGDQPIGTWVLIFLNSAREVLTEEDAEKISAAVKAVDLVMENQSMSADKLPDETINALFADLIDREPPKPPSLLALEEKQQAKKQ